MIIRLLLAALIITAAWYGIGWLRGHSSKQMRGTLLRLAMYGGIALLIILAVTGRLNWLVAIAAAMLPLLQRLVPLLRYVPFARQAYRHYQRHKTTTTSPPPGQNSTVNALYVVMTLNHSDGSIDGVIIKGPYRDRHLTELSMTQLLECLQQWQRDDTESARLLAAYLDHSYGETWRRTAGPDSSTDHSADDNHGMTEHEAIAILGLSLPVTREAIIAAHRRLMQKMHPDRGGSTYLAAKINQAKDLLLTLYEPADH